MTKIARITVAASAGYCFGVRRAMNLADQSAPAYTLGPLIHNAIAVQALTAKGVLTAKDVSEIPDGARAVIRSHGVSRETLVSLKDRCEVIDATCPYVSKIHQMAQDAANAGKCVIVAGHREHPEVIGTLGWAGANAYVVSSEEEARMLPRMDEALVVAQTTLGDERYRRIADAIKTRVSRPDIRNTVCSATQKRQAEARELASQSDVMLVVGDPASANTNMLYKIAKEECARTYLIESASALGGIEVFPNERIGITAGASTPDCTYKEVVARMNDIENKVTTIENPQEAAEISTESDFASEFEKTMVQIRPGQTITGKVVQITEDEVCVNIGYKADGLVKKSDLCVTDVKIDDEIEVEVVKVNDGEGNVLLSQKNLINRKNWDEIVAKSENGEYVDGVGKEAVKGGLLATVNGIRTFIPASQLSLRYVEKIDEFVGQEMKLKIIELDRSKKRIVASRKAVLAEEESARKKAIWSNLEIGSIVTGTVRRIADFGAFVDIGGVDGLVHVTDLSWGRVKHPSDVIKVGDVIEVKIMNVDPEKERVSLSYKQTQPRPWTVADEKYPVGSVVEGKVVRITTFGAFVELEPGLDGLVHISQCALTHIEKVEDALHAGDIIRVKVLDVNTEAKRISLSVRQVLEDEALEAANIADEYAIEGAAEE
ncbi:MAG: bifunctional 4-hydroxy-3-methylbut-2-enyl diphosphate reductase/30S ribosomal protein S1 [Clostridia bacterium]|nr:bifunctional 4-hydroxy-3-methylbut-2-enyl diphosphate reductase/30S ribosomal protein S1 [Clostridia bacterium]